MLTDVQRKYLDNVDSSWRGLHELYRSELSTLKYGFTNVKDWYDHQKSNINLLSIFMMKTIVPRDKIPNKAYSMFNYKKDYTLDNYPQYHAMSHLLTDVITVIYRIHEHGIPTEFTNEISTGDLDESEIHNLGLLALNTTQRHTQPLDQPIDQSPIDPPVFSNSAWPAIHALTQVVTVLAARNI